MGDSMDRKSSSEKLTVVFVTTEVGLLPLAAMALEQRQIGFATRLQGRDAMSAGGEAYRGSASGAPIEILVSEEDAAAAADLLRDLAKAPSEPASTEAPSPSPSDEAASGQENGPIDLIDESTNRSIGRITDADLAWLGGQLEKESVDDTDYYFDAATLDMLEAAGGRAGLIAMLRRGLGSREGMDVQWSRRY
jgi:hypothetical protein